MPNPIYITLSSDDNYARHMGIVTLSLLANTAHPERLFFYFLDAGIEEENREHIREIIHRYNARCKFIRPDSEIYTNIPKKRYGVAALFRLSLGSLLPEEIKRVIYLDCDVLAFDDVAQLWQVDLDGNIVGAVTNLGVQAIDRLNIPDGDYFNSGVLLIDMEKWRSEQVGEKTLAFMNDNIERLIFPDQDGLNCILKKRWKHLPLRWNQQPASYSMHSKGRTERSLTPESFHEAIRNPAIVHYLGKNKPWDVMTFHPLRENYWGYLEQSPWSVQEAKKATIGKRLKKALMLEKHIKHLLRRMATPKEIRRKGL